MSTTSRLLFSCFFCIPLTFLTGCGDGGGGRSTVVVPSPTPAGQSTEAVSSSTSARQSAVAVPSLTPVEQADVDEYMRWHGREAIIHCLTVCYSTDGTRQDTDKELVFKYVNYFISQGIDVNAMRQDGTTPLHLASAAGDIEVVKFLVSKGADVNAKKLGSHTPLEAAKQKIELTKQALAQLEAQMKADMEDVNRGWGRSFRNNDNDERGRMYYNKRIETLSAVIDYLSGL